MNQQDGDKLEKKQKYSIFFYNGVTYLGVFLALFFFIIEVFLFIFDFLAGSSNLYLGILTFAVLPAFLILGLILIPVGALWKRNRYFKGKADLKPHTLFINPELPTHRNAIFIFIIGTGLVIIMTSIGTYKAYQYTESVAFCGLMCHSVMKPEHTAYTNSPHARVKCVECHIGEGAAWYVRAKLSGLRQVYHTIKGDYSRPISTPVHNLRPAEETCERCHWPEKFYSSVEMNKTYFTAYDSEIPDWHLRMMIHVGSSPVQHQGIHKHMFDESDVYFAAEDDRLQEITWIQSINDSGKETIYTSPDSKWKNNRPPPEKIHKMDCVDCHNRPTHQYLYPSKLINQAMANADLDPELPGIKSKAMALLSGEYKTEEEGLTAISDKLTEYYKKEFKSEFSSNEERVNKAIAIVQKLFKNNMFPEMKARWDAFPDNIGHLVSPGCFRCHDGEHSTNDGKVITRDCTVCHTIIEQGPTDALETNTKGLPFVHPFEDDGLWQDMNCVDCHTGN